MGTDQFIEHASAQQSVTYAQRVIVPGPELTALLQSGRAVPLLEIYNHPDKTYEVRQFVYGHILEPGATHVQISDWEAEHPALPLPDDLKALLKRVNGIHLWADLTERQSYFGILPLAKWCDAAAWEWGVLFDESPVGMAAMSYHVNGDFYLLLDTKSGTYHWYDTQDFDNPTLIGASVQELLSWWWNKTQELDPRLEQTEEEQP